LSDLRYKRETEGRAFAPADLNAAIMDGAVERVRPKMTTFAAIMAGLLPMQLRHRRRGDAAHRRAGRRGIGSPREHPAAVRSPVPQQPLS
jgi:hypothetical protein